MNPVHILLVDDEEQFTGNMATLLQNRGFHVQTASRGFQALDLLAAHRDIAVVVLDLRMPEMDGLETLTRIKSACPDTAVIMLTGRGSLEDGVQALRQGAFDYVQKPCEVQELEARIRAACRAAEIRRHPVLWPRSPAPDDPPPV